MNNLSVNARNLIKTTFVILLFIISMVLLYILSSYSDWHDFDVFYHAASAALSGESVYVVVGQYNLPFWYPPWIAWLFIPFALFSKNVGLFFYQMISAICVVIVVNFLSKYFQRDFSLLNKLVIFSFLVPMSFQLISVGQMEFIFLFMLVTIIWAVEEKKDILVGVLFPFLLVKPHLIIPFSIYLFLRAGKRAFRISILFTIALLILATFLNPEWYLDMYNRLMESGPRTDGLEFTTFPSLFGFQENWLGTANLPITIVLIMISILVIWRYRETPTVPFLSVALAASLFCAPRAYTYDFPLLIPAVIWLTAEKFNSRWWLWMVTSLFPIIVLTSSYSYLVVLFVFGFCIYQFEREINLNKKPSAS